MAQYNRVFKAPRGAPPLRSPSPPNAFVEPLSPNRPMPMEPFFNYPAITSQVNFTGPAYAAPTASTRGNKSHRKGKHHRTPSTIDTLAEAALAVSPSYDTQARKTSERYPTHSHVPGHRSHHSYGGSEPPHKRARSDVVHSPHAVHYTPRPATSYTPHDWQQGYNSRVEEAALLLNFQSGGWPGHSNTSLPLQPPSGPRPHANSFPQDGHPIRPVEALAPPPSLLPPFTPQASGEPQRSATTLQPLGRDGFSTNLGNTNGIASDSSTPSAMERSTPSESNLGAAREDVKPIVNGVDRRPSGTPSVATETTDPPKRRGWPKGKPRGTGARKTMAEKAATKRAAQRKAPESRGRKANAAKQTSERTVDTVRRKSLSDIRLPSTVQPGQVAVKTHAQAHRRAQSVPGSIPMIVREVSPSKSTRRKAAVTPETICAGCGIARESKNSRGELDEWICCNGCKNWFHIDCAGFKKAHEVRDVDKFFCTTCEGQHGKTTFVRKSTRAHTSVDYAELQKGVLKTSEESVEHHYIQPIKDGTFEFDPEYFPRMRPEMVTQDFFEKSGAFTEPICIPAEWNPRPWTEVEKSTAEVTSQKLEGGRSEVLMSSLPEEFEYDALPDSGQDRLEMVMPENLTVRQVCQLVGPDVPLDVIDVKTQNSGAKWTLSRWADYYEEKIDAKAIRNVISLEVSQTRLGRLLQRPKFVRDIDLQDDVWPQEEKDKGKWPKVQFYCLMSIADSYTDFHIDFGGSSVYYHILRGSKTFFFIPPKAKHLKAYEEWNNNPQQNYTFLPHITKECYRVDLSEGDTMLIPSGWIHAVWTPNDSLVIGGNFLNRMAYKNQFRVVDIEKANETPMKFRYPYFQKIMWYTAIKYLRDDPLPPSVSEMFYDGKQFAREQPIWADFDGSIADSDERIGAHNTRYYSQAEMEGLPDLVNFIFRTVMLVMGRLEGVSQDRIKRVNTSIPKGYGEPLEVAKTFALWVAWKRGNEDPPAWAHPDAVLPNSKEEGPPKKLSERKLKELERREAIAAYRIAPDRQSARVMSKTAAANSTAVTADAVPDANPSSIAMQYDFHTSPMVPYPVQAVPQPPASPNIPPTTFIMSGLPGQHLSTPKTSVLGPKRVACDACRKRRIRCKHKDVVVQASPEEASPISTVPMHSNILPELHDNILVNQIHQTHGQEPVNFINSTTTHMDGVEMNREETMINGDEHQTDDSGPLPGTNAYVNANIPMMVNGTPMFGETPKRGRSKACYDCRKSKRRCIHDENGNVDPVKAVETPVMRGAVATKKRPSLNDGSPLPAKKHQVNGLPLYESHRPIQPLVNGSNATEPLSMSNGRSYIHSTQPPSSRAQPAHRQPPPEIDPDLFAMYTQPHTEFGNAHHYAPAESYGSVDHQPSTQLPSLEDIANEVLVDMTGPKPQSQATGRRASDSFSNGQQIPAQPVPAQPNVKPKLENSVDSAVSIPSSEELKHNNNHTEHAGTNGQALPDRKIDPTTSTNGGPVLTGPPSTSATASEKESIHYGLSQPPAVQSRPALSAQSNGLSSLPLYRPPAPLPPSPERKRAIMHVAGASHTKSTHFSPSAPLGKLALPRLPTKAAPVKPKKLKFLEPTFEPPSVKRSTEEQERQSMELARSLQQEELGLRRRSK